MFRTVTASFKTRRELLEWLDRMSVQSGCSRSSLIEAVLNKFLTGADSGIHVENRVEIKGVGSMPHKDEAPDGITFVTIGGVRVGLPKKPGMPDILRRKAISFPT